MWVVLLIPMLVGLSYLIVSKISNNITRGWIGGLLAIAFILILQMLLLQKANSKKETGKLTFFDLIVTSEDNKYSLSRLQIYMWTVWIVFAFTQLAFATLSFPSIPVNVAILLGINGVTAALSSASVAGKTLTRADRPDFIKDIFFDKNGTIDFPRMQVFIWTVIILITHMVNFWSEYYISLPKEIQNVSEGLLILMGVSNGAYLGVKAAQK